MKYIIVPVSNGRHSTRITYFGLGVVVDHLFIVEDVEVEFEPVPHLLPQILFAFVLMPHSVHVLLQTVILIMET